MKSTIAIREILFPTDFSEASRAAGETAASLARHFSARLHILHVVPPVTDPTPAPASLRAVAAELEDGFALVTAITSGLPARQIASYARRNGIDLIVMGAHGRTGVSRALLGSVVEAVVRRSPCRVMTVPAVLPAETVEPPPAEERDLCAVCREPSQDLICERCRARIRGEALERKRREERPGH